ncbi:MAG: TetR/AcrR family transcriptional regulator [Acidimicrobiaceae bacterium]|nr:TetR/AcrR family transcriptional regulator [Acidimicrobiaceae bacterium]
MEDIVGKVGVDDNRNRWHLLRESGRSAILDQVAQVLSDGGLSMSMSEVAEAAGVGRATLYRYFPNRQALLDSISARAIADLAKLIAGPGGSPLQTKESLARISRAVLAKAGMALMFMRERILVDRVALEETFIGPLNKMIEDGQKAGVFAQDISSRSVTFFFLGLLRAGIVLVAEGYITEEESAANVIRALFDGFGTPKFRGSDNQ